MSLDQTTVVVVDIEATCWKGSKTPPGEQSEIIEVGVCLLDTVSGTSTAKRSLLIKPTRSKVSHFCTKLTSISPEMVADGISFAEACAILQHDYATKSRLWISWGNYDHKMFVNQCASYGVDYPFSDLHMNIKEIFAKVEALPKQVGMARALKMLELPLEGTHHRGHDDAWNISRIIALIIQRHGRAFLDDFFAANNPDTGDN